MNKFQEFKIKIYQEKMTNFHKFTVKKSTCNKYC